MENAIRRTTWTMQYRRVYMKNEKRDDNCFHINTSILHCPSSSFSFFNCHHVFRFSYKTFFVFHIKRDDNCIDLEHATETLLFGKCDIDVSTREM